MQTRTKGEGGGWGRRSRKTKKHKRPQNTLALSGANKQSLCFFTGWCNNVHTEFILARSIHFIIKRSVLGLGEGKQVYSLLLGVVSAR